MEFRLSDIKQLVEEYGSGKPCDRLTPDKWLNDRYCEYYVMSGMHARYYQLFYKLAEIYKPKFVVELGSYWATAAAHFASGCPTTDVITIDAHFEIHPGDELACIKANIAAELYDNLQFIHGRTWDNHVIAKVCAKPYPIDILFIDAGHDYKEVMREWELYSPLLAAEALVMFDDICAIGVAEVWNGLDYEKFIDAGHVHPGHSMGFLRFVR